MFKRICAILLTMVLILYVVSVGVVAATFTSGQAVAHGIDVSEHQGYINWDSVKSSGKVDFAIIRCGYGQDSTSQDDDYFLTNVQECQRVGIPFGLYIYSYATTTTGASGEADHAIRLINQCKSYSMFRLPIYYDLEENSVYSMANSSVLALAQTFHDKVESSTGKTVGIYANTNWFNNKLTDSWYQQQPLWCAQYNSYCQYAGDYDLWQYSDSGSISGISGGVDVNYSRVPVSQLAGGTVATTLSTNKSSYLIKDGDVESVMVTATCAASNSWVGIFPASADVTTAGSIAWFYCNDGGASTRDIWYCNYDTSVAWPVAAGNYKVVLFGDSGKTNVLKTVNITLASATITTDASTYCVNNNIYVSTDYYGDTAWVGLYENGVTPSESNSSLYWYYLSRGGTSNTNIFGFHRVRPDDYKAGKYDVILFADSGYDVLAKKTITVKNCTDSSTDSDHNCDYCGAADITSHTYDQKNTASKYKKSAANCTKKAVYYYSCRCGAKGTSTFSSGSALGHSYKSTVTTEATCTTDGVRTYTCSTCSNTYTEAIPAIGSHSYNDGVITTTPTCTENGVKTYTCTSCGYSYTETIAASGSHKWEFIEQAQEQSCTTDGIAFYLCWDCGEEKNEVSPATGHTEATVYENNATTGCYDAVVKCSDCGEVFSRISTDIPNGTAVNTSITSTTYLNISDSVGIITMFNKNLLSSYSNFGIRYARIATDSSYNLTVEYDKINNLTAYGTNMCYAINKNIGLYEMNLPLVVSLCGYDENGNIIAVSSPYITTVADELWLYYEAAQEKDKTFCLDLINLGTYAQTYFVNTYGGADCGLSSVVAPNATHPFDQSYASKNAPVFDEDVINNTTPSATVTVGGKSCVHSKTLNLSGAAPALQYMITRGNRVTDPQLWSAEFSYTDGYNIAQSTSLSGVSDVSAPESDRFVGYSKMIYANFTPALYDSNKTIRAKIYYDGKLVYDDVYCVDAWLSATLPTLEVGSDFYNLVDALAKFGVSARVFFEIA